MKIMTSIVLLLALTDTEALSRAKLLWGDAAFVRHVGANYQVGCMLNGNQVYVVASEKESYDKAFEKVSLLINGPRLVEVTGRDAAGNVTKTMQTVYICNKK